MTPTLNFRGTVAVLELGTDENRFSAEWLDTINAHIDTVETQAQALVTTGVGKFYSYGLDLDWLTANTDRGEWYVGTVQKLFARILTFPLPTLAAVNGHAFGAGAMLALAHDYRIMRSDRGYYCFPEVDIRIPFTPGMAALIQAKLTPQTAVTAMTTGHRFGGPEAKVAALVDDTATEADLIDAALTRMTSIAGKDPGTLGAIKNTMYRNAVTALVAAAIS
ncbi:MAG: enoyl-CoA hydratase-related protein [Mycobacterium sp.]|nr:enoyl-CoA hydratase-related protein [Mycobacterium sp.]